VLPHLTTEDTVYDGYLIPKGSMLFASIKYEELFTSRLTFSYPFSSPRFMLRDERFWDNPTEFRPERFLQELKEGQVDPRSLIFGFGRRFATNTRRGYVLIQRARICPGRDLASHLASTVIMILLWAFEIVPVEGEARPDPNNPQFTEGMIAYVH